MYKTLAACAVAAMLVAAPSFAAEPPISNPGSQMENLTLANVAEIVTELGAQNVEQHDTDGNKIVTFTDQNIPYNMLLVCEAGNCTGLVMLVAMETGTNKYPLEVLNASNKENILVTITKLDEQKIGIGRAMITEGGVTKKNVAINVATFVGSVQTSIKYLASQLVAGIQQGSPAQFQRTSLDSPVPRPVFLQSSEMAAIMRGQHVLIARALAKH